MFSIQSLRKGAGRENLHILAHVNSPRRVHLMAAERRVAALSRHFTSVSVVSLSAKVDLRDFAPEDVYLFLTRDNVELRAKMLDFLQVAALCQSESCSLAAGCVITSSSFKS